MGELHVTVGLDDKRMYAKKGFWISPKLVDDDVLERLRAAHERLWRNDFDGDGFGHYTAPRTYDSTEQLRKYDNGWWVNDEIRKIVTSPAVGEIAAELMNTDEVRLWHDQILYKPGSPDSNSKTGNVGWHQDYSYWKCSSTTNMITMWLALQDTDVSNGGMQFISGSHNWGLLDDSDSFFDQDLEKLREGYERKGYSWHEEPSILPAGHASFHHALTLHGSGPNRTLKPRLSIVAHLMPKGTAYRARVQFHPNVPLLGPRPNHGQLFEGEYFPLLFSRSQTDMHPN